MQLEPFVVVDGPELEDPRIVPYRKLAFRVIEQAVTDMFSDRIRTETSLIAARFLVSDAGVKERDMWFRLMGIDPERVWIPMFYDRLDALEERIRVERREAAAIRRSMMDAGVKPFAINVVSSVLTEDPSILPE